MGLCNLSFRGLLMYASHSSQTPCPPGGAPFPGVDRQCNLSALHDTFKICVVSGCPYLIQEYCHNALALLMADQPLCVNSPKLASMPPNHDLQVKVLFMDFKPENILHSPSLVMTMCIVF